MELWINVYFYACAATAVCGALATVLMPNPIRGAMGLLLMILSLAGLFLAAHAQFLAAIQLIVYAGAIIILFLFVIMLLGPEAATPSDRRGLATRVFGGGLFGLSALGALTLVTMAMKADARPLPFPDPDAGFGGIDAFGSILFADALVPFEISSALLMVAVIGAIAVAKGRQGVASLSKSEQDAARTALPSTSFTEGGADGVFSHEIHVADADHGAKETSA